MLGYVCDKKSRKNALKILGTFADPLGLICPLVLQVKLLFKEACILDGKWDNLLPTEFVVKYNNLIKELRELLFISVPRYRKFGPRIVCPRLDKM